MLEQVGRKIVHKCGRLPLAISVIGGILRKNISLESWETVSNKIEVYLRRADGTEGDGRVKQVLSLSYDDLPLHLKPCFLYFSLFQEDEIILARELYWMWVAEGIVSAKDQGKEETLIEVAEQYLRELAARSMVLVQGEANDNFELEGLGSCRLHDLLRDMCLEKSMEEEFLHVVDFRGGKRPTLSPPSSFTSTSPLPRRLAVSMDSNVDGVSLTGDDSTQKLRSLQLRGGPLFVAQPKMSRRLIELEKLKFLRMLNFRDVSFEGEDQRLAGLGSLVHWRFLSFWDCFPPDGLPSCIGDLPFLQVLGVNFLRSFKMPNVLHKLKRLKCLYLPFLSFEVDEKLALSGLDELEEIYGFDSRKFEVADLATLKGLRRLQATIAGNGDLSKFLDFVEHCRHLKETALSSHSLDFGSEEGMALLRKLFMSRNIHYIDLDSKNNALHGGKLPDYEPGFFPNLTGLSLRMNGVSRDPMATLEKLPKLRRLALKMAFDGEEMNCSAEGFPQLRYLELYLPNLKAWKVEEGAMPRLSYLRLHYCIKLEMIPEGIKFITTLQTLHVEGMSDEFRRRIQETGPDFNKVRHVDSIITMQ